jgi:glucose/arabinose dehydrogenase
MKHARQLTAWLIACYMLVLSACGGGGGGGADAAAPTQNRVDIAISGLPGGAPAAVAIADGSGRVVATLTASGSVAVSAPGAFTIRVDPVLAEATYVGSASPSTINVPAPPSVTTVNVKYAVAPPLKLRFEPVVTGLASLTFLASPPGSADIYVVEQPGRIRKLVNNVAQPVLDISSRVSSGGERGMLSLAFDPQFAGNGHVFVYFTDPSGDIAIERFALPLDSGAPAAGSIEPTAVRVLTIPHRAFANHNGGQLQFGPDGMLYIGTGDGGGGGDPLGSGQNLDTLLGKLLRIDVTALPYRVPPDNPFAGQAGKRPEIWAYGLRNPWRFSFDVATRSLYIADVGQGSREEVDVATDAAAGLNFGWNLWEGTQCYPSGATCSPSGMTMPLLDYGHEDGCSITGGYVYRGQALPEVAGRYFYSDYCSGWLRSFVVAGGVATERTDWSISPIGNVQSFGVDSRGELYALTSAGGVFRLVRQ